MQNALSWDWLCLLSARVLVLGYTQHLVYKAWHSLSRLLTTALPPCAVGSQWTVTLQHRGASQPVIISQWVEFWCDQLCSHDLKIHHDHITAGVLTAGGTGPVWAPDQPPQPRGQPQPRCWSLHHWSQHCSPCCQEVRCETISSAETVDSEQTNNTCMLRPCSKCTVWKLKYYTTDNFRSPEEGEDGEPEPEPESEPEPEADRR